MKSSVCRLSFGRSNLTCLIKKTALESLLLIFKICVFQESDSSIVIPRICTELLESEPHLLGCVQINQRF